MSIIQTTASVAVGCVITLHCCVIVFRSAGTRLWAVHSAGSLHYSPADPSQTTCLPDAWQYVYQIGPVGPHISTLADPVTWRYIISTG